MTKKKQLDLMQESWNLHMEEQMAKEKKLRQEKAKKEKKK